MSAGSIGAGVGGAGLIPAAGPASFDLSRVNAGGAGAANPNAAPAQLAQVSPTSVSPEPALQQPSTTQVENGARRVAAPEVAAGPAQSTNTLDQRVSQHLGNLQKREAAMSGGEGGGSGSNAPTAKVAKKMPGPAEKHPGFGSAPAPQVAGEEASRPGLNNLSFENMLQNLRDTSAYSVQVSLVTKTTSSFTGAMNKLMSSQ